MKFAKTACMVATLAGIAAAEDTIWSGTSGVGHVKSGGYWYSFNDASDGGNSTTNFPAGSSTVDVAGQFATSGGGMFKIIYTINPSAIAYAFAGVSFNWLNVTPTTPSPQTWSTVCVEYSLTGTIPLQLQINNLYALIQDNNYLVTLPKSATLTKKCYATTSFVQRAGAAGVQPLATCMSQSTGLQFEAVAPPTTAPWSDTLKLKSVTSLMAGETAIESSGSTAEGVRLVQSGREIGLDGMEGRAQIVVADLRGRVLMQETLVHGSWLRLSDLEKGVYVVRADGESVHLSRSIVLP